MLRTIDIENFRGFSKLTARPGVVTVIIGPNSAGKTTLLHAVRVALQALDLGLDASSALKLVQHRSATWIEVTRDTLLTDHIPLLSLSDRDAIFFSHDTQQAISIRLTFDGPDPVQEVEVTLRGARNQQVKLDVKVRAETLTREHPQRKRISAEISNLWTARLRDIAPKAVFIPAFYGVARQEERRARAMLDHLLNAGDQSHIIRNMLSRLSSTAWERLNTFMKETLSTELTKRTLIDKGDQVLSLRVMFRDTNGELELSAAGAGLVNLIALYAALELHRTEQKRPLIFLLDEPEAHLHPRLQGDMAHRVADLISRDFDAQTLIATHAVEIINRLALRPDTTLLRVDRAASAGNVIEGQPQLVAELSQWADLTPFSTINFLASRRVLFHEGKDDAAILQRCAELYLRQRPADMRRFQDWSLIPLDGVGQRNMGKLLQGFIKSSALPGLASGEKVRLITLLDKDLSQASGVTEQEEDHVIAREVVWSKYSVESIFLEPRLLSVWIRAFLGDQCPQDIEARIEDATIKANQDSKLNVAVQARLATSQYQDAGRPSQDREIKRVIEQALKTAVDQPEVWQKGKDRARFILGELRAGLPTQAQKQFRTDLVSLLTVVNLSHVLNPTTAIPKEARDVLDLMVSPSW